MSGPNIKKVSDSVAEVMAEFRGQLSDKKTVKPYFSSHLSTEEPTDTSLAAVRTKLLFDSPRQDETKTEFDLKQRFSLNNMKRPFDISTSLQQSHVNKRLNISPGGIDWSPASKEQRSRLLDTVDSRIFELQSMATKNIEFKRELMDIMDQEKLAMQRQKEKDQQTIKVLQEQVQSTKDEMYEMEQKLIQSKSKLSDFRLRCDQKIQALQSEKSRLEAKLIQVQGEFRTERNQLMMDLEQCQEELQLAQNQSEEQMVRLTEVEEQLAELKEREFKEDALQEELDVTKARVRELEIEVASAQAASKLREVPTPVSATARRVRELEEQLSSCRDMLRGKLLLEENNASLQAQLKTHTKMVQDFATLEELCKRKQAELIEWHKLACGLVSGEGEMPSAQVVSARIQQLEQVSLVYKDDLSKTMSQMKAGDADRIKTDKELRSEQERCLNMQSSNKALISKMQKMERKLQLITQERDSIQSVLSAYEGDITVAGSQLQQLQRQRLESAETSARELRTMVESLEKEIIVLRNNGGCSEPSEEIHKLQEKIKALQKDLEVEKARSSKLEERAENLEMLLEQRAMRGDYDPGQTKIIHYSMNPAAQEEKRRAVEVSQLRQSNDKLRERVRVLETVGASASTLNTTAVVDEHLQIRSNKELTEAREKLKQAEIKSQRLVEAFKKTSQSFRQAVYLLFGYKTDALADNNFRLSSMFAEREDEHLLFKILGDDRIEMVQTSFSNSVPELIKTHLEEQGNVPAFLSALTLDLFSRQTFTS